MNKGFCKSFAQGVEKEKRDFCRKLWKPLTKSARVEYNGQSHKETRCNEREVHKGW